MGFPHQNDHHQWWLGSYKDDAQTMQCVATLPEERAEDPLGYQTTGGRLTSWIFIQELRGILEKQNE